MTVEINAEDAKYIVNHPIFKKAFAVARENLILAIENGDATDKARRDEIMLSLQLLKAVRENIESHIMTGKIAQMTRESEDLFL